MSLGTERVREKVAKRRRKRRRRRRRRRRLAKKQNLNQGVRNKEKLRTKKTEKIGEYDQKI